MGHKDSLMINTPAFKLGMIAGAGTALGGFIIGHGLFNFVVHTLIVTGLL